MQFNPIRKKTETNTPVLSTKQTSEHELLLVRSANDCISIAKSRPIPKMLFSEFWHQGELCFLFADTNIGKSILSVQIANSISKGEAIRGFKLEAEKQTVLYFDFEMSIKQFEKRYSKDYGQHYDFDNSFLRIEINPDCTDFDNFEKSLFESLEISIMRYNAQVLIIDNLTYLKTQATETAKEALPLMKLLKDLKLRYSLSILTLAHTPKRNLYNPITRNDLAGSKHLANFADSIFAIGESQKDKSLRYLKQIKTRDTELIYDSENVLLCEITKAHNFLGYEFVDFSRESEHLKTYSQYDLEQVNETICELRNSEPSISRYEIAKRLNINQMKVKRVLDKFNL
jgi:RecA-family ATPase